MKLSLRAPAKINWFLSIAGKRDDGYHNIISPMQCVSLFDTLSFEDAEKIEVVSDLDLPIEDNLVYRAAVLIKKKFSCKRGARITLKKDIPVAAGLGGGSSDAAFTLTGLNRLWGLDIDSAELMRLGSEIGSDVPFFMDGPFSLVEGRGEKVSALKTARPVAMLLVKPDISISAAWAYRAYKAELTKKIIDIKLFCQTLDREDFTSLRQMIFNDLEDSVIDKYHIVADIKKILINNGAVISSMSGSGPTVFGVFNSVDEALRASENAGKNWCRVVKTLT